MSQNGETRSVDPAAVACANLGELIEVCSRGPDGSAHIVTSIRVNGCEIPDDRLGELESFSLDGIQTLEVASAPSRELAISSLANGADYAGKVVEALSNAVDAYRTGDFERGSEICALLSDSLCVLLAAVSGAATALGREAGSLGASGADLLPWIESLVAAQAEGDWVRVADCLEYEIAPLLEDLQEALRRHHAVLSGQGVADGGA